MTTQTAEIKAIKEQEINTMLTQLGGRQFFIMTGTKPQYKDTKNDPMLAFKLARNSSKANYMKLTYVRGLDTYTLEFVRIWGMNEPQTTNKYEGLHAEDLQRIFTEVTGLYTKL
jgi:hypothetical protein